MIRDIKEVMVQLKNTLMVRDLVYQSMGATHN